MKKILIQAGTILCATFMLASCELDEYNPAGGTGGDKLTTFEGWSGMETYCYEPLYGQLFSSFDFLAVAEGGTDLFLTANNRTWGQQLFYYEGLATNTNYTNKLFKQAYSLINSCNAVIEGASSVAGDPEAIKVLTAEAKCLRAYYYSLLTTYYGNVTLNLRPSSEGSNLSPQRATYEELYTQMVKDLTEAAADLPVTPYNGDYARVTKKTALGLLARVYAQGAGEGLTENGVSYWSRAAEVAGDLISNQASYGAYLYPDVEDVWANANNKKNKEALFIAAGPANKEAANSATSNIFTYLFPNPYKLNDIYKTADKSNYLYGRINNNIMAPSKYLIDLFDAAHDRRWDNCFTTAFGEESMVQAAWGTYASMDRELTAAICQKYGIDMQHVGKKIHAYADLGYNSTHPNGNQYPAKVWPKGDYSGDITHLVTVKNIYATEYPLPEDEDRFAIYLSKDRLTAADKAKRAYVTINIDDLFDSEGKYIESSPDGTNCYLMFPALNKFSWMYDGAFTSNLQRRNGDVFIMRMAEVYLIAAEAEQKLGNATKAAEYLNVIRKRACRNAADFDSKMKLSSATEQDVLDEFAREMCGEFNRWSLLKRHKAFESQLKKGNPRAAKSFTPKNYLRPISFDFLNQISNAAEYGTNGYD
jgi:hypothetical protein